MGLENEATSQTGVTCPTSVMIHFSIPSGALSRSRLLQRAHKVSIVCVVQPWVYTSLHQSHWCLLKTSCSSRGHRIT
ncbi:rCG58723 [Rattus norvegicus]|uniref:RCG58723 n=1 Tax=Rattus norvegicus TaxID=10116 RepID=A6JLJ8_RAT|nr:rCG58723 [Rattus norvegicus]